MKNFDSQLFVKVKSKFLSFLGFLAFLNCQRCWMNEWMNGYFDKIELLTHVVFPPLFSFLLEFLSTTTKYNHCNISFKFCLSKWLSLQENSVLWRYYSSILLSSLLNLKEKKDSYINEEDCEYDECTVTRVTRCRWLITVNSEQKEGLEQ